MKFLPEPIERALVRHFAQSGEVLIINDFSYSSGGCINSAGVIESNLGLMFVKWNNRHQFPGMFESESKGLNLLREPGVIRVPKPITHGEEDSYSFLLTEFIQSTARSKTYWELLGEQLAALHRNSSDRFGLDHNNYIGSLFQINTQVNDWLEFYIQHRLEYQLKLAVDKGKIEKGINAKFQKFYKELSTVLPTGEPPNLVHGDLWSGNLMTGSEGEPVIFDPAVYFGHREVDLAMTKLFGGFSSRFYDVYNETFPLKPGINERIEIYQLYPLLVHVNLFGGGYGSQVKAILNRYT